MARSSTPKPTNHNNNNHQNGHRTSHHQPPPPPPFKAIEPRTLESDINEQLFTEQQETIKINAQSVNRSALTSKVEEKNQGSRPRWQGIKGLSLRTKAIALAVALGTFPVLGIGAVSYYLTDQAATEDTIQGQQTRAIDLSSSISRFALGRYNDVQILSKLPILANSRVQSVTSIKDKQITLDAFSKANGYDSIAVADLAGNTILQSSGEPVTGLGERDYFQEVIKTKRPTITSPRKSQLTGEYSIFAAAPIMDTATGRMVGVVRTRTPVKYLDGLVKAEEDRFSKEIQNFTPEEYHAADADGKFFLAQEADQIGRDAKVDFAKVSAQFQSNPKTQTLLDIDQLDNREQLVTVAPLPEVPGLPELKWSVFLASDTSDAFAAQRQLLLTYGVGITLAMLLVSAIAAYLASQAIRPVLAASDAVEKLGQGELDARIDVVGQDEIAKLGSNINRMAEQIQTLLGEQEAATLQQLAAQAEIAQQQTENAEQQKQAKEFLQKRALELLMEVDPVSRGDLTIRAKVTEDEIGTIADSYNATISSLKKIVTQVQSVAQQVATTAENSGESVQVLSGEALQQAQEITAALEQIQEMANSIRVVAANAEQAEVTVQQAAKTVEEGDAAMNRTVDGIMAIRETVAETSKKVKRLGESSQKISKVVNLIGTFAAQTNLLALNASIEAARAGEEGRGFAVVADEVRSLARQSASATAEIEKLVAEIQTETNEVVAAMEAGTEQVVVGTKLVDETRQSLNKITTASAQISELVEAIAQATVTQSQASEVVSKTMNDVAAIADRTLTGATQVSTSFQDLLTVAQELQANVGQFKVG